MADLRIGSFLAPNVLPVYETVTEAVGRRLGMSTELVVETDYENCLNDVNDVCFVCSLAYIVFQRAGRSPADPVAAPVLHGRRYDGRPIYFSDVIVAKDGPIHSFVQLRGRSWAYNEPLSHSGYGITRYHLTEMGETQGFFGEVVESGFHEASIRLVADGTVDGSVIDSQVLAIEFRDHPSLRDQLRVIESLGPSTIQPVAISRRLDSQLKAAVVEVLLTLHNDPATRRTLAVGMVDRFVPIGASAYDDIRAMLDACEKADFLKLA